MNFENFVKEENSKNSSEIIPIIYKDKKYWIKKARATFSSKLHKFYYSFFPFEVLLPVKNKTAKEAMFYETSKIEKFKEYGVNTPQVVFKNEEFFVLEDCGKTVNSYIRKKDISKEKMYYFIDKLLMELSKIHNHNDYHGGAQARNFTYKDGEIFTIDLEDSFEKNIDLKLLQFRDFLLLLLSLTKTRASFQLDYRYIIDKYISLTNNNDFKNRLKKLANKISFLIFLSDIKLINRLLGRDVKSFFKLFKLLKNL